MALDANVSAYNVVKTAVLKAYKLTRTLATKGSGSCVAVTNKLSSLADPCVQATRFIHVQALIHISYV